MALAISGSLDANLLLRLILGDDPVQYRLVASLISREELYSVSTLAVAEVVFILQNKGWTRPEIAQNLNFLISRPTLYIMRATIVPALELYLKHFNLSFVDSCLVYEAEMEYALPLYTFDRALAKKSGGRAKLVPA